LYSTNKSTYKRAWPIYRSDACQRFEEYCIKLATNVTTKYAAAIITIIKISFLNLDIFFISYSFALLNPFPPPIMYNKNHINLRNSIT